ncbi:MAG: pre-peptidase C-terminal domain-containing protein [Limnospira sp.]
MGKVGNDPINHRDNIGFNAGKSKDKNDYYKFKLTGQTNQVNVVLDNLKDNAELQLLDRDGKEILFSSTENGKKRENIDVELDRGTYYLRVYPKGDAKTKYDLSLTAETILQDADGQPEGATNLGPLSKNKKVFNDEIGFDENGTRDNSDYYKFTLTEKFNNLNIVLDGLKDDANIELLDNDGKTILDQSRSKGKNKEIIDGVLDAGTYYVKVEPQGRAKSKYRLSFDSDQIDDPDGTLKRADDLGILRKKPNKQRDEIGFEVGGKRDQKDYYEFTLKKDSEVNLSLDGLNQNADLKLLSRKGDLLYSSTNKGKEVEQISTILDRGKYYALVEPVGSDRSEYILSLNADSNIEDPDAQLPGKNLGKLKAKPISKTDDIGFKKKGFVDTSDFWKFELTKETDVTITLDRLSQNADLELYDKDGTTLIYSSKENGKKPEEISSILDKGTYYIKVKPNSGSSTDYKLSVSGNTKIGEQDDALPGTDLGELGTKKVTKRNKVGFESSKNIRDVGDFYNFSLAERSDVNITLDGLTGDANLSLLGTDGRLIDESQKKGKRNETIDAILQPGNYYIGIEPNGGKVKTNYNLGVTANPVNDDFNNIANAKQLGSLDLQDKVAEKNRVGFKQGSLRDAGDYYGFSLSEKANVNLSLDGLKQDANLFLLDAKGKEVGKSTAKGSKAEGIDQKLKPGDYYVAVFPGKNAKTDYELSLGVTRETLDLSSLKFRALDVKDGLNPGEKVKVNYQINNTGNIKADAFEVGFYLSDDEGIDSSDLLLGTAKVKSLSGGKNTKKLSKQLTLPAGEDKFWQGAGDYYLGFVVDSQGAIAEDNELNNTASQKVSVDIPNDLSISNLTTDRETVNPGEEFNVSLTVGNTGGSTADTFRVGYYFSQDNKVTTSDTLLGTDTVKKLAGNTTTNLSKKLTLPSSVSGLTDFYIGAIADDQNAFVEVNETNNTAKKALSLGAVPDDSAGGELKNARDIGVVGEKAQTFSDFVGDFFGVSDDNNDYYKLELDQKSNLNLSLTGLRSNASLYLLDKNGYSIESSTLDGKKNEAISHKLLPGTYYVQVENYNANTPYNLEISAPALSYPAPQITGWNYDTALDIGTASSTAIAKTEYVGNPHGFYEDLNDFYKFQVDTDSTVKIDLTGLSANADLSLYDSKEYWSAESHTLKNADENITKNLTPGTYFIEVKSVDNTNYDLQLSATPRVDTVGNDFSAALSLGTLGSTSQTEWVGNLDTDDYYSFTLAETSTVNLGLTGMNGNGDLYLYDSDQNWIDSSSNYDNADESISRALEPGTYYVQVNSYYDTGADYNLTASATAIVDTAGNTFETARNLGAISTAQTIPEWVGNLDDYDYYQFTISPNSSVSLNLSGLAADANLYLYDSEQNWLNSSENSDTTDDTITASLGGGTYYALVQQWSDNTNYNFTLSATPLTYSPANLVGNTEPQTKNIGALGATQTFTDFVGSQYGIESDKEDFYQFTLAEDATVSLSLGGLSANADLTLHNSEGYWVASSSNFTTVAEAITQNLVAGTYTVQVNSVEDASTGYNLQLSAIAHPDGAGETFDTARSVDILTGENVNDWVGDIDEYDYYQFTLDANRTINVQLSGLSQSAALQLYDSSGSSVYYDIDDDYINSYVDVAPGETGSISALLGPDTYFVSVSGYYSTGDGTNYDLHFSAV